MGSKWSKFARAICIVAVVSLAVSANAQVELGDNLKFNLNGSTGLMYSGGFGNQSISSHQIGVLMDFNGRGYYFHPNFLSFNFHPYYNRSQANSDSQSVNSGTGIGLGVGLFSGSRFPLGLTYSKDFSNGSNFRSSGIPTISTNGSSQSFGVNWSENLPKLPSLTVNYVRGSSSAAFGDTESSSNSTNDLTLNSSYRLKSWNIQSGLSRFSDSYSTPAYLTANSYNGSASGLNYNVSTGHELPLHGYFNVSYAHSNSELNAGNSYGSSNYTGSIAFNPFRRFSVSQSVNYVQDLTAYLLQSLGSVEAVNVDSHSTGLFYTTSASYYFGKGVSTGGYYNFRKQDLAGKEYAASQFGGNVSFAKQSRLFGFLNFGVGMADTAGVHGNNGGSINMSVSMNRRFGHYETSADYTYSQNVLTLGTFRTTSDMNYGGSVRRRVNRQLYFSGGYRSGRNGIVARSGEGNLAQSFNGQLQWKKYSFGGGYSLSHGTAVLTTDGTLTPATPDGILIPSLLLLNAHSYSFSVATTILRHVDASGTFALFSSDTASSTAKTANNGSTYNARLQYRLRKFQFGGGFSRSQQESSTITGGPRVVNSFFLSFSRWFNVF